MNNQKKTYYKSDCGKLIEYNHNTELYRVRNTINWEIIQKNDFYNLNIHKIKKEEFSRLMNIFFKSVKHEWEFEGKRYKKIDNFEANDYQFSSNYNLGKDVPFHEDKWGEKRILVYHWGKVYFHTISYGGYKQGQLIDPKTGNYVRWAQLKHCSPIFCITDKKIV